MWRRLWMKLVDWYQCGGHAWSAEKFHRSESDDGFVYHSYSYKCLKCGRLVERFY